MLELIGLSRRYGDVQALDRLTFCVPKACVFGLLGPNGAGKTTAMRCVFGITVPDAGEVRWDGRPVGLEERLRFGYLPEERGLYPSMRIVDQLVYLGRLHGLSETAARRTSMDWLERLGLAGRAAERVDALSLGNQQRVQLTAALVHDPELLVLDEPYSGLDPAGIDVVSDILAERAAAGATVVFSSHQLDLVEDRCDAVAIVHRGRLVAEGLVQELTAEGSRLVVEVEGDVKAFWLDGLRGVRVSEQRGAMVRLELDGIDPQDVLDHARSAGRVLRFGLERRRLSEVFREAVR